MTKSYGGVVVLDAVDLTLEAGEIRALVGENGAGKSTLIKVLAGVVKPDSAKVCIDGDTVDIDSPMAAFRAGISTLHQELSIVPGLSVAENVFLGQRPPTLLGRIQWKQLHRNAEALFEQLGHPIDARMSTESLSPVGRTMTALARALSQDSGLLILDEPTASMTDAETSLLFNAMRRLKERGVSILYVSHRLAEVMEMCDTFTVLRGGVEVASGDIGDTSADQLITAMAGRSVESKFAARSKPNDRVRLSVRDLSGPRVRSVSFNVAEGEVFGIAGLAGSGRSEIVRMLSGAQHTRDGVLTIDDEPYAPRSIGAAHRSGVAMVPQERRLEGLLPDSIERNANITNLRKLARGGAVMSRRRSTRNAAGIATNLDLHFRSLNQPILTLSGGNQQKVVLGKFLALDPRILLLDESTRGVDVGTKQHIYRLIAERAAAGAAVVVVSSELPELLGVSHRIGVMHEGTMTTIFDAYSATEEALLHACYGRAS